ncbi:hypothetical protein CU098_008515 [Rhizopus stolonifer]|uniref:Uncharacterized protein n=1 Tax=Rhizopus stolonifer TaxID=4846 RepID=A0A367K7W4_RHIST|nr:hypothetical protein CU098_008515 [Rhizopus stolonifer]
MKKELKMIVVKGDLNEINLYDIPIESIGFNTLPPDPSFQGFYYPQLQNYFPVYPPMQYTEHFSQYEQIPDFQVVGKKAKSKKRKPKTDPNAPSKPKRKTGLNKPLILSSVLSEFMDAKEA